MKAWAIRSIYFVWKYTANLKTQGSTVKTHVWLLLLSLLFSLFSPSIFSEDIAVKTTRKDLCLAPHCSTPGWYLVWKAAIFVLNNGKRKWNEIVDVKFSVHLRTLGSSWYGISGTPFPPNHLLAWLEMAARLDRLEGGVWLSRDLLSLDGYNPMSRNSFRMSSVIKISPWNSSYPSNKRKTG